MKGVPLSIIIPVYNSEKYLEKCIRSVLDQTYKNFELILVDDASKDASGQICDRLAKCDTRIKVLHHNSNRGLSLSREDGLHMAEGEWVSFVDNDDFLCPIMYEQMMGNADNADMVCIRGEDKTTDEIDNVSWDIAKEKLLSLEGKKACDLIYSKSLDLGFIEPVWGKIIKKTLIERVLKKVEPYKEKLYWVYMEDVLFMPFLFYYADRIVFDNVLMYLHRRILNNLSSTLVPKEYHYEAVEAGDILLSFFKEKNLNKAFPKYLIGYFMLVMSTWYKVWKNEKERQKVLYFNNRITQLYEKFKNDICAVKTGNVSDFAKKSMVLMFRNHRVLWGNTIGRLYFEVGRKVTY